MDGKRREHTRFGRLSLAALVLFVGLGAGAPAVAQEAEEGGDSSAAETQVERGREIVVEESGLRCRRPEAWVRGKPGKGAVLTLRAAGDPNSQIEVRVSSPITQQKREDFFNSFHSKLKSAGFIEVDRRRQQTYGERTGQEIEYEGSTSEGAFRLVVWQYYRGGEAWLISGFFPVPRRDEYYPDFAALIESIEFSDG